MTQLVRACAYNQMVPGSIPAHHFIFIFEFQIFKVETFQSSQARAILRSEILFFSDFIEKLFFQRIKFGAIFFDKYFIKIHRSEVKGNILMKFQISFFQFLKQTIEEKTTPR